MGIEDEVREILAGSKAGNDPKAPYQAPGLLEVEFGPAPDLESIGQRLIRECNELAHLENEPITYLWKREGGQRGGKVTLGKCVKATRGLLGHFAQSTWVVWLAADHCNDLGLNRHQVEALLHHELCHAGSVEDKQGVAKPKPIPHDFDGFLDNVKRYGAWQSDLKLCQNIWQQATLFE